MWTYSGDPSSSPVDEVRFLVGDTDESTPQLQDEEISYLLKRTNPPNGIPASGNYLSAAYAADALAAKYAHQADKSIGDLHVTFSQKSKQMRELAADLRRRATAAGVTFVLTGMSIDDRVMPEASASLSAFRINGMSKNDVDW